MKARLVLFLLGCSLVGWAQEQTQTLAFDCSMPAILAPLIQGIRYNVEDEQQSSSGLQKCKPLSTVFEVGSFIPDKHDESEYDSFIAITYQMPETTCKLYIKNNIVMKIEQENMLGSNKTYVQTIVEKIDALNFANPAYLSRTQETVLKIFAQECILLKLRQGVHKAVLELKIEEDVDAGTLKFPDDNLEYRFCYYKNKMENAGFLLNGSLIFSMTLRKGAVGLANVYDDTATNGFDCGFYTNQGLSFYLPMTDKEFADVVTWSLNGKSTRSYPWKDWLKQGRPTN